jgi:hypothetical protein
MRKRPGSRAIAPEADPARAGLLSFVDPKVVRLDPDDAVVFPRGDGIPRPLVLEVRKAGQEAFEA